VHDRRAAFRFRQHDGVGLCRHDGIEIGIDKGCLQSVHAHQDIRPRCRRHGIFEKRRRALACACLGVGSDRVFEIDDQRIGAARHRFVEFFGAIGRNEQE
jgi:hypothetical protein